MELLYKVLLFTLCSLLGNVNSAQLTYGSGSVAATTFTATCADNSLEVAFPKADLDARTNTDGSNVRDYTIHWEGEESTASCKIEFADIGSHTTAGQVTISAAFDECGIVESSTTDDITYTQTVVITYGSDPTGGVVSREEYDSYAITCTRAREQEVSGSSFDTRYREDGSDSQDVTSDYDITLTHEDTNGDNQNEYKVGDKIVFKTTFTTSTNTKAVVQKCWSTSDGSQNEYVLIDSRCADDEGTTIDSNTQFETQFTTEAYRYLSVSTSSIYVECLVRVCLNTENSGSCAFCGSRKRRDLTTQESAGEMALVKSPTFVIIDTDDSSSKDSQESSNFMSGTNATIVISLLAILVLVIAAAVIKKVFFPAAVAIPANVTGVDNKGMA